LLKCWRELLELQKLVLETRDALNAAQSEKTKPEVQIHGPSGDVDLRHSPVSGQSRLKRRSTD
jgi:hypothetical protein